LQALHIKNLEEILEFVLNAGSNAIEVFDGKFDGGYELQQNPTEISNFLYDFQSKHIDNFLEIGVAAGGNTRIFTDFLNIHNICTMDLGVHPSINSKDNPNARDNNFAHFKHSGELLSFIGDSHSLEANDWLKNLKILFDMVFIDGDHTETGIELDTKLVLPYLKEDAYVIYHDTVVNVGSLQFDIKLKSGVFPELVFEKEYINSDKFRKGIAIYRYVKK
jgi:hypothetical protein